VFFIRDFAANPDLGFLCSGLFRLGKVHIAVLSCKSKLKVLSKIFHNKLEPSCQAYAKFSKD
jgi:hypothetical protein